MSAATLPVDERAKLTLYPGGVLVQAIYTATGLSHLVVGHPRPDDGEQCARLVFRAGHFVSVGKAPKPGEPDRRAYFEDAPRWHITKTDSLTVQELVHCSSCGWGGYFRDGRLIDQDEWPTAHIIAARTVLHRSWQCPIPADCFAEIDAREHAKEEAEQVYESTDWAARDRNIRDSFDDLEFEKQALAELDEYHEPAEDSPVFATYGQYAKVAAELTARGVQYARQRRFR